MKPLDFVKTPNGNVAMVVETNSVAADGYRTAVIAFVGRNVDNERLAWWGENELVVIDNLPRLLAHNMSHPFGTGKSDVKIFYGEPS